MEIIVFKIYTDVDFALIDILVIKTLYDVNASNFTGAVFFHTVMFTRMSRNPAMAKCKVKYSKTLRTPKKLCDPSLAEENE